MSTGNGGPHPPAAIRETEGIADGRSSHVGPALVSVEIIKRCDAAQGFVVLPKRWIVERSIAWLNRCRRLAKDRECLNRSALAFLRWASVRLMIRKLCQQ